MKSHSQVRDLVTASVQMRIAGCLLLLLPLLLPLLLLLLLLMLLLLLLLPLTPPPPPPPPRYCYFGRPCTADGNEET